MSDYREVQHGYNILQTFFSDQAKHNAFTKALDVCTQGVALEAIKMFDDWWTHIRFSTYISSISEHDDLERICTVGYQCGELLARVDIVLNIPTMSQVTLALGLIFSPSHTWPNHRCTKA